MPVQPFVAAASAAHTAVHAGQGVAVAAIVCDGVAALLGDTDELTDALGVALAAELCDSLGVALADGAWDGLQGSQQAPGTSSLPAQLHACGGQASRPQRAPAVHAIIGLTRLRAPGIVVMPSSSCALSRRRRLRLPMHE